MSDVSACWIDIMHPAEAESGNKIMDVIKIIFYEEKYRTAYKPKRCAVNVITKIK